MNNPQVSGVVMRVRMVTPRKPNSASSPTAKMMLSNKSSLTAHMPGSGHNLSSHSNILMHGGGASDLPGVSYTCISGVYDFYGLFKKTRSSSMYGAPQPQALKIKLSSKFSNI